MDTEPLAFPALTTMLKAAGESTRLRILALIAEAELTVSDLTEILRQSQPRLSRHLRLLAEAGLVERFREGSWAFFRMGERGSAPDIARAMITRLDLNDPIIARDRERLAAVRAARAAAAQKYFRRHAVEWDRIRRLHVADTAVEEAIRAGTEQKAAILPGRAMIADHRRILATGIARLRAKIKYRPVVFELMPPTFTLLQLQRAVEALAGHLVHKPNFRRLIEQQELIEETGATASDAPGRPAKLYRFRHGVLAERAIAGTKLPLVPPL